MENVWDKIKKGLRDGATMSMEKIEEYTKVGKLKLDELAAKRKIDRHFADIGQLVFDMLEENKGDVISESVAVKKAVDDVKALREELVELTKKIEQVQEEAKKAREARGGEDDDIEGV